MLSPFFAPAKIPRLLFLSPSNSFFILLPVLFRSVFNSWMRPISRFDRGLSWPTSKGSKYGEKNNPSHFKIPLMLLGSAKKGKQEKRREAEQGYVVETRIQSPHALKPIIYLTFGPISSHQSQRLSRTNLHKFHLIRTSYSHSSWDPLRSANNFFVHRSDLRVNTNLAESLLPL